MHKHTHKRKHTATHCNTSQSMDQRKCVSVQQMVFTQKKETLPRRTCLLKLAATASIFSVFNAEN